MSVLAFILMTFILHILAVYAKLNTGWNLTEQYGLNDQVKLTDVTVCQSKAYACVPRVNIRQPVTLLELPWPEAPNQRMPYTGFSSKNWKPKKIFRADQQKLHYCHHIQSAVALDVDKIRSHLYVLDAGYEECYPKIVIYDLKAYKTVQQTELLGVNGSDVSTLVVDARPLKGETRVFMGSKLGGYITVFDPGEGSWHRVALICAEETDVSSEFLAISKFQLLIYFTSTQSNNMYSVSLRDLRNLTSYMKPSIQSDDFFGQLKARCLGEKLGTSKGLYVDIYGGINYVYARDFAAVRWIPSMGLSAEGHKVLLQSRNKLPAVTKILADSSYLQVWAINEKPDSDYQRFTVRINSLTF